MPFIFKWCSSLIWSPKRHKVKLLDDTVSRFFDLANWSVKKKKNQFFIFIRGPQGFFDVPLMGP